LKKLQIGFTYDAKADYELKPGDAPDKFAEFDSEATLSEIAGSLASPGHDIVRIGHAKNLIKRLDAGERWDIVFNIAEGISGRNRESQVPAILEVFDIPFVGSDPLTMGLTLDKTVAKMLLAYHGLSTPKFLEAGKLSDLDTFDLKFPVIAKPSEEGTSKGISEDAIVRDKPALRKRVERVIEEYGQPALIEEFIIGQEFTVAVIGNDKPEVLPPVQVTIKGKTDLGEDIYTHERVTGDDIQYLCPSPAPKQLLDKLIKLTANAYKVLGCRDFSRMDFRVDNRGIPFFLECNPLPNLGLIDVFPLVAKATGRTYQQIVVEILNYGIKRYNLI
jgi:D-alanine-D-alanine ligase